MRTGIRRGTAGAGEAMIGRRNELRRLLELAGAAQPGAAPGVGSGVAVAMLAGEPGIGKTRLVRELVAQLPAGTTVLLGQAEPGSLGRPFELLLSAIEGSAAVEASELELLADSGRGQVERLQLGLRLLTRLLGDGPAVVIFEDLHWADPESVALLERAADLDGARLLVGTYRPAEVIRRHPVAGLLDRLERRHEVYHVQLERWTPDETSAYLASVIGRPPPYRAAMTLHHRTGGNPFFLEELLRDLHGDDLDELCDRPLPWSLAETLRRQVEHLEPAHQRIVEAAAVLGNRVPFDLLATVSGLAESELIWALRSLVGEGVLVETGEDEFAFRHALVREAVAERLLGRERRRLHEAALDALLAGPVTDWALLAKHARGAGRYDDMLRAARAGSDAHLALGSPFQALQLAELGLEEDPDDRVLLHNAAQAAWLAGLPDDADEHVRRWLGDHAGIEDSVTALSLRIRIAHERGDSLTVDALTGELVRLAESPPAAGEGPTVALARARAMAMLAFSTRMRDLDSEARQWVSRALDAVEELTGRADLDPAAVEGVRLAALGQRGALLADRAATLDEGRALLLDVADRAEAAGEWLVAVIALNRLLNGPVTAVRDVEVLLERMRAVAERAGSQRFAVAAYFQGKARLAMRRGRLSAALDAIVRGRAHDLGYRRSVTRGDFHGVFLAGLLLETGDLDAAARVVDELASVPSMAEAMPGLRFHLACRGGDLDRARALLPDLIAVVQSTGGREGHFLHDLVSAAIAAPLRPDEIAKLIDGLDGPTVEPGYRRLAVGQFTETEGDLDGALAHYRAAADTADLPPAARGSAHVGAARTLIGLHRPDEAREHARAAGELLAGWGGWRVAQLAAVRSRLGLRDADEQATAGDDEGSGLTVREREVAQLIAEGLTNAEIAGRLFISPRTAAVHVSNILRKLAIGTRAEVAAALARR